MKRLLCGVALAASLCGAARADETVLRFATISPTINPINREFYQPWAQRVEAASDGTLKIDLREGLTIATIQNIYPRVLSDVAHIGFTLFNYVSGKFNYSEVASLPFIADTSEQAAAALWRLYASGALDAEYDEAVPLMLIGLPQSVLHMAKPIKNLDDWGGAKIITPTKIVSLAAARMGGTPLTFSTSEIYEAMQRGVADGAIVSFNPYRSYKLGEVTTFHVDTQLGTSSGLIFMSRKTYTSLPAAGRKAIDANSGEAASRAWARWWDKDNDTGRQSAKDDPKHTVVTLSPEQTERWRVKTQAALEEWVRDRPGRDKILAQYRQLLADVKAGK